MRSIESITELVLFVLLTVGAFCFVAAVFGLFGGLAWKVAQWVQ